jgi:hypothetical protein
VLGSEIQEVLGSDDDETVMMDVGRSATSGRAVDQALSRSN